MDFERQTERLAPQLNGHLCGRKFVKYGQTCFPKIESLLCVVEAFPEAGWDEHRHKRGLTFPRDWLT